MCGEMILSHLIISHMFPFLHMTGGLLLDACIVNFSLLSAGYFYILIFFKLYSGIQSYHLERVLVFFEACC